MSENRKMKHLWMVEDYPARGDRPAGSAWTKIGVAFENRDGSWAIDLKAIPVNGKLQMRDPAPPKPAPSASAGVVAESVQ